MEFTFHILGEWNILSHFESHTGISHTALGNTFVGLTLAHFPEEVKMIRSVPARFEIPWNSPTKGSGCPSSVVHGLLTLTLLPWMTTSLGSLSTNSEQ